MAPSILIIDDQPGVRFILSRVVEREGYVALHAESGAQGYEKLVENLDSVALIFLDLRMPGTDGFVFRWLQFSSPEAARIPTIVMTGMGVTDEELQRLHPVAWLPKPANLSQLQLLIRRHARAPAAAPQPVAV